MPNAANYIHYPVNNDNSRVVHPLPIRDQVRIDMCVSDGSASTCLFLPRSGDTEPENTKYEIKEIKDLSFPVGEPFDSVSMPNNLWPGTRERALANACIAALDRIGMPGVGLKLLRLVSKQANRSLVRAISGYTLLIDGRQPKLPPMSLLKQTQLSYLRVVVDAGEGMDAQSWNLGWS